ncbi:MAG: CCA tRNA nucleotidyltransferase [Anaerorhabdus sp.]
MIDTSTIKKLDLQLSDIVIEILTTLHKNNHEAYIVGGFIRNFFLKTNIVTDYDLATSATPDEIIDLFKEYVVDTRGIKYGVIQLKRNDEIIDIATFRKEEYCDNSRYNVNITFTKSVQEDSLRRDFTINAIYYSPYHKIKDFYNGLDDLNHKLIKTIKDPYISFKEDPLRIIRALKLKLQYDLIIDHFTLLAMQHLKHLISNLSKNVVTNNFISCLKSSKSIDDLTITFDIFSSLFILHEQHVIDDIIKIIASSKLNNDNSNYVILIAHLANKSFDQTKFLNFFSFSKIDKEDIKMIIENHQIDLADSKNKDMFLRKYPEIRSFNQITLYQSLFNKDIHK